MGTWNVTPEQRREMITKKAYELFVKRGGKPGHELDDWLEAEKLVERELKEKNTGSTSTQAQTTSPPRPAQPTPAPSTPTPIRGSTAKVGGYKRVPG